MKRVIDPTPDGVTAGQFHHSRHEHQFEKEELEQKHRDRRDRFSSRDRWPRPKPPRREKNREEARLQQKDVPLKA